MPRVFTGFRGDQDAKDDASFGAKKAFKVPLKDDDPDEDIDVYKQEFEEIYSQSQMSDQSENLDEEEYAKSDASTPSKSDKGNSGVQKYSYLVELVNQLKKLREIELKFVNQKFADLEAKLIHDFLYLESQNDKASREIKEHKSIMESANIARGVLLKSYANIQQIRRED